MNLTKELFKLNQSFIDIGKIEENIYDRFDEKMYSGNQIQWAKDLFRDIPDVEKVAFLEKAGYELPQKDEEEI